MHMYGMQKNIQEEFISAVIRGQATAVQKMLAKHGSSLVHYKDADKRTALHYAGWIGSTEIARMLLAYGAQRDIEDGNEKIPHDMACDKHTSDSKIAVLLKAKKKEKKEDDNYLDDCCLPNLASVEETVSQHNTITPTQQADINNASSSSSGSSLLAMSKKDRKK